MFSRKHQCHSCAFVHPKVSIESAVHYGYECPACGVNLKFPTKQETAAWNRSESFSLISSVIFLQLIATALFVYQSALGTLAVIATYCVIMFILYRFRPAPLMLKYKEHIYPQHERDRLEKAKTEHTDIAHNIAVYQTEQTRIKKNKHWWQVWI